MYTQGAQGNSVTGAASGLFKLPYPASPGTAGENKSGLWHKSPARLRVSIPQQDTFTTQHLTPGMCILILCFDKQISTYFDVLYLGELNSVRCAELPRGCSYF